MTGDLLIRCGSVVAENPWPLRGMTLAEPPVPGPLCPSTEVDHHARASATHPRDNLIISLALGTGLRLGELVGLNVCDVYIPTGHPRSRVYVRPAIAKRGRCGDVFLPDALVPKLRRFWGHKRTQGESVEPDAPLLCAVARRRLSKRRCAGSVARLAASCRG